MIQYQREILDNGLTVLIEQDTSTSLVAVNVLYKVGSRDESPERTGFAHLFEHLMFGGSKNVPDFDYPLQMAGGENNAFTNSDYTNYYNVVPASNIETALWIEADRMAHLNINETSLETQRKVVVEEFHETCLNKPYGDYWLQLLALAYQKHSYNWPTIGKVPKHIEDACLDDVRSFYERYYQPSNAVLSISGPLSKEESLALAKKWFGNISNHHVDKSPLAEEPMQSSPRYKEIYATVPSPMMAIGCHMPSRDKKDYYACDLLTDILANGKSARLYRSLVRDQQIFSTVDCYVSGTFDPGLIVMEGRPSPGVAMADGIDLLWQQVDSIKSAPPSARELEKVKNKVISSLAMNDLSVLNKAISLAYFECLGNLELINGQEQIYHEMTVDDIVRVADRYLDRDRSNTVVYFPE